MKRLTTRDDSGNAQITCTQEQALERLARYEDTHESLLEEYQQTCEKIEQLKKEGRMRGVTANQLIAQKMSLNAMLIRLKYTGIDEAE